MSFVEIIESRRSGIGEFNSPYQLSISAVGDIYIADCYNGRIQVLHPIRVITHPSMHTPLDVKVATEEIYVLNSGDATPAYTYSLITEFRRCYSCVHVFTHYGDGFQVSKAYFFSLDANKSLVISDWGSNQVKIFSNEGLLLQLLGNALYGK